jgi:hypothetical protein
VCNYFQKKCSRAPETLKSTRAVVTSGGGASLELLGTDLAGRL